MCFEIFFLKYKNLVVGKRCSFRDSVFLNNLPDELLKCVRIAYLWVAKKFTSNFTRIPPHVMLMAEMEGLRRKCATLRSYIKVEVKEMMADRGFGGL